MVIGLKGTIDRCLRSSVLQHLRGPRIRYRWDRDDWDAAQQVNRWSL